MIKLTFCLTRLPHTFTREAFQASPGSTPMRPLVASVAQDP